MNFCYFQKNKTMKVKNTLTNLLNEYVGLILIACTNKLFPRLFTFESLIKHDYHDSLVLLLHIFKKESNAIKQILQNFFLKLMLLILIGLYLFPRLLRDSCSNRYGARRLFLRCFFIRTRPLRPGAVLFSTQ